MSKGETNQSNGGKWIVLGLFVLVVGGVSGYLVYSRFSAHRIVLPLVEPTQNISARVDQLFGQRTSQLVVTARLPFKNLADLAEKAVPARIDHDYGVPDTGGFSGIHVRPHLIRDPLGLAPEVNSTPPKVQLHSRIHGNVDLEAFKWIIAKVTPIGPTIKTKSPTVTQPVSVDANIGGWISPGIDRQWNLTHQEHFDITMTKADAAIFGVIHISLRDRVQEAVNGAAPGMIHNALDAAMHSLPVRSEVEKIWKEAFKPVKISSNPDAYVLLAPEKIRLQNLAFDNAQFLTVRVALDGRMQTQLTSQAPPAPTPAPLLELTIEPALSPLFHVLLPVGVELSALNSSLQNQLPKTPIDLGSGVTLAVHSLSLYAKSGQLYLKAEVEADNVPLATKASGTIFLKCAIAYDASAQQLRLRDVDFSVETKNMLAQAAAWLVKDTICRRLQDDVKLNVNDELEKAKRDINTRYASVNLGPGAKLNPHLEHVTFEKIQVHDNLLVVGFDVSGEVQCDLQIAPR